MVVVVVAVEYGRRGVGDVFDGGAIVVDVGFGGAEECESGWRPLRENLQGFRLMGTGAAGRVAVGRCRTVKLSKRAPRGEGKEAAAWAEEEKKTEAPRRRLMRAS